MVISVQEAWESFESHCVSPEAGVSQRSDMRTAFYAGVTAMYWITREITTQIEDEDEAIEE